MYLYSNYFESSYTSCLSCLSYSSSSPFICFWRPFLWLKLSDAHLQLYLFGCYPFHQRKTWESKFPATEKFKKHCLSNLGLGVITCTVVTCHCTVFFKWFQNIESCCSPKDPVAAFKLQTINIWQVWSNRSMFGLVGLKFVTNWVWHPKQPAGIPTHQREESRDQPPAHLLLHLERAISNTGCELVIYIQ